MSQKWCGCLEVQREGQKKEQKEEVRGMGEGGSETAVSSVQRALKGEEGGGL